MSKKFNAAARFAIRTSPLPGSGIGVSASFISSGSPHSLTCQAFIVFTRSVLLNYDSEMTGTTVEASSASQSIMDLERDYLLHNYSPYPLVLRPGKGPHVYG